MKKKTVCILTCIFLFLFVSQSSFAITITENTDENPFKLILMITFIALVFFGAAITATVIIMKRKKKEE